MDTYLNEIINYYAKADVSFLGGFEDTISAGFKPTPRYTNPKGGGLIFPLKGSACFTLNGKSYILEPGTVVHAGPEMKLTQEVIGNEEFQYIVMHYCIPITEGHQYPLFNEHFSFAHEQSSKISYMTQQILIKKNISDATKKLESKAMFMALLLEIFKLAQKHSGDDDIHLVESAMNYIQSYYADEITIEKLAYKFGIERRRFSYLFKQYTGMSPSRFLIECRILKSKELLRTCSYSVKQVAEYVGYADNLYFSKSFKKFTGVSPSEFQEELRKTL